MKKLVGGDAGGNFKAIDREVSGLWTHEGIMRQGWVRLGNVVREHTQREREITKHIGKP